MRSALNIFRHAVFVLAFLLGWMGPTSKAAAVNKAVDFRLSLDGTRAGFVVLLDGCPDYSLKSLQKNQVSLTLYDTVSTSQLDRHLEAKNGVVTVEKGDSSSSLRFMIPLKANLRDIRTSWLAEKKLFFLSMELAGEKEKVKEIRPGPVTLENLRFGIQDTFTRMVADLSRRPSWELIYRNGDRMTLRVEADKVTLKREKYTGLRRIREAALNQKKHYVDLDIRLENPTNHFRVFWLKKGDKLVTDFCDQPLELFDATLRLHADKNGKRGRPEGIAEASRGPEAPQQTFENGEGIRKGQGEPEAAVESTESLRREVGFIVRQGIQRGAGPGKEEIPDNKTSPQQIHAVQIRVEPDVEKFLPEGLYNREWVHHLSAEEAFLIGRIQEAWEIKNFEKGITLMERFLKKFSQSPMRETLSFLIGDFRLALLKRGNKDIFPQVMGSYANAISRFKESGKIPRTYVRMAQANGFVGRDYEAIGYLNRAVSQFREGDHLPLAYLNRGKIFLRVNQPDRAIEDLKMVLNRFPQSPVMEEARYEIAKYFFSIGAYEEAGRRFEELTDINPDFHLEYPGCLSLIAQNYFYQKNYDKAREYYFKALNIGHQSEASDLLLSHIGDTYHQQSKEREAEKFYKLAIEQNPEGEGAAIAKLRLADYSSGVKAFQQIHKENLNSAIGDLALLNLGKRFYERKQYQMAMDTLRKVMEKPSQAEIFGKTKDLYARAAGAEIKRLYRDRDYEKVIGLRQSQQIPTLGKMDPEAYLMVAQSYYHLRQYPDAVALFAQIRPYDLSLRSKGTYYRNLADSYIQNDEEDKAERLLINVGKDKLMGPDQQKIRIMLAGLRRKKGDLKGAYELFDALVSGKRMLPDSEIAGAYLEMGKISNSQRQYEKARDSLNRCVVLAEKDRSDRGLVQSAWVEMGKGYYGDGNYKQVIRAFGKAFDLGYGHEKGDYWDINYLLALSYLKTGNHGEAERLFNAISDEGDPVLQQKAQIKMGMIDLEKQLNRLPLAKEAKVSTF